VIIPIPLIALGKKDAVDASSTTRLNLSGIRLSSFLKHPRELLNYASTAKKTSYCECPQFPLLLRFVCVDENGTDACSHRLLRSLKRARSNLKKSHLELRRDNGFRRQQMMTRTMRVILKMVGV
jgi:hypothetical protein